MLISSRLGLGEKILPIPLPGIITDALAKLTSETSFPLLPEYVLSAASHIALEGHSNCGDSQS